MKILVGIMHCIENELDECIASLQSQTHKEHDHFIIRNLPNKEAHMELYQTFMNAADEYQLFIKLDADMVLHRDTYLEEVVKEFCSDPDLTLLQVAVHDFFTNQLIFGLHNYRNTMRWENRPNLFTDKQHITKKTINDSSRLAPAAFHCPNPSRFQAFHFGIHKAVKVMQIGDSPKNLSARNIHWENLLRTKAHYRKTKDLRLGYAVLGAEIAFKYRFSHQQVDFNNLQLQQSFDRIKALSLHQITYMLRRHTRFRWLPSPLRLAIISLLSERKNFLHISRSAYLEVFKNMVKKMSKKDGNKVQ
ncbi:MAG: hypothetical protein AAF632_15045 [Bacteroidota bacterium]